MSEPIFDSGLLDFAANEGLAVEVVHNIGRCPKLIQFYGDLDGELGFPRLTTSGGDVIPGPYLEDVTDSAKLKVYKPDAYNYAGKFRVKIIE